MIESYEKEVEDGIRMAREGVSKIIEADRGTVPIGEAKALLYLADKALVEHKLFLRQVHEKEKP